MSSDPKKYEWSGKSHPDYPSMGAFAGMYEYEDDPKKPVDDEFVTDEKPIEDHDSEEWDQDEDFNWDEDKEGENDE